MGWFFKECEHDWDKIREGTFVRPVFYHKCKKCGKKEKCFGDWMNEQSWAKVLRCTVCGQFIDYCD